MQTLEIRDGVVQNIIVIQEQFRAYYQHLTGCSLVDVPDYLPASAGDAYDSASGKVLRNGRPLAASMMETIRRQLLAQSDYTQTLDYPCDDQERDAWRAYRQTLRDMGDLSGAEDEVEFPARPVRAQGASIQQVIDAMLGEDDE